MFACEPPPHSLPRFMLRGFWEELVRRGVSSDELESASGVARPRDDDFVSVLSQREVHGFFAAGVALTGDEALGLSVGRTLSAASFHWLGHLALASATLAQALEIGSRIQPHRHMCHPSLEELTGGCMRFGMSGWGGMPDPGARVEAQLAAAQLYALVLYFIDTNSTAPTVQFAFSTPTDLRAYRRAFAGSVEFDAGGTFILFSRSALLPSRSGADPSLVEHFLRIAQKQYRRADVSDDWSERVRHALRALKTPRLVRPGSFAAQFGLTSRGLARRLGREGTRLSVLIEEELFRRSRVLIREPGATGASVAATLGYAEQSSFFRAFRRWTGGLSPSAYRRMRYGVEDMH